MNLWHTSTELQATGSAVAAKTVYLAAGLELGYALGLELTAHLEVEVEAGLNGLSDKSDTSG